MKSIYFSLSLCCFLLCACGYQSPEDDKHPEIPDFFAWTNSPNSCVENVDLENEEFLDWLKAGDQYYLFTRQRDVEDGPHQIAYYNSDNIDENLHLWIFQNNSAKKIAFDHNARIDAVYLLEGGAIQVIVKRAATTPNVNGLTAWEAFTYQLQAPRYDIPQHQRRLVEADGVNFYEQSVKDEFANRLELKPLPQFEFDWLQSNEVTAFDSAITGNQSGGNHSSFWFSPLHTHYYQFQCGNMVEQFKVSEARWLKIRFLSDENNTTTDCRGNYFLKYQSADSIMATPTTEYTVARLKKCRND